MLKSQTPAGIAAVLQRKKLLGLTMISLLSLDSANKVLAHPGGGEFMPVVGPIASQGHGAAPGRGGWASMSAVNNGNSKHGGFTSATVPLNTQVTGRVGHLAANGALQLTKGSAVLPHFILPNSGTGTTELGMTGNKLDLDLTSTAAEVVLGSNLFKSVPDVTINVGGAKETFAAGSTVTAAQYVAIEQVLGSGTQGISLSSAGAATGGTFSLNAVDSRNVVALVIPASVKAIDYVSKNATINVNGDLTNYGSIDAVSTSSKLTSGSISATDITNEAGATITSTKDVSLTLDATNNISNAGSITSSGALTLNAGGNIVNALPSGASGAAPVIQGASAVNLSSGTGNFTNSGLIASTSRNVNFNSPNAASDINLNGSGGTVQALAGNINVRDASYAGSANLTMTGGDYLSNNLNLYSGTGAITGNVGNVTGIVHNYAESEHFIADSADLQIGSSCIKGDPTFFNVNAGGNGNITLSGIITAAQALTVIATGDIDVVSGTAISAQAGTTGEPITLIAGANITTPASPFTGQQNTLSTGVGAGTAVTYSGASSTGGQILFAGPGTINSASTGGNTAGGAVTLAAFGGSSGTSGTINLAGTTINTSGFGTGNGGAVTIIGGANNNTITVGNITTTGGGSVGSSGPVLITTAAPTSTTTTYNANGSLLTGGIGVGSANNGSIVVNGNINTDGSTSTVAGEAGGNAGAITLNAGDNITVTGTLTAIGGAGLAGAAGANGVGAGSNGGGGSAGGGGGSGGVIGVTSTAGSISVTGIIDASGGAGAGGGIGGNGVTGTAGAPGGNGGNGGNGGDGGAGGAGGNGQTITLTAGAGSIVAGGNVQSVGGAGGAGGGGGTGAAGGAGGAGISAGAAGGNGGNGGSSGNSIDTVGTGGSGGNGQSITLTATGGNIQVGGNLQSLGGAAGVGGSGGSAGAGGGGGAGIAGAAATDFTGATGGTGGNGGTGGDGGTTGFGGPGGGTGGGGGNITATATNGGISVAGSILVTGGAEGAGGNAATGADGGVGGSGGDGGTGALGQAGTAPGNGGIGGNGGDGGTASNGGTSGYTGFAGGGGSITITATGGGIFVGANINSSGGASAAGGIAGVGGTGGSGGTGGMGGTGGAPGTFAGNGGTGGAGGFSGTSGNQSSGFNGGGPFGFGTPTAGGAGGTGGLAFIPGYAANGLAGNSEGYGQPGSIAVSANGAIGVDGYIAAAADPTDLTSIFNGAAPITISANQSSLAVFGTGFSGAGGTYSIFGGSSITINDANGSALNGGSTKYSANGDLTSTTTGAILVTSSFFLAADGASISAFGENGTNNGIGAGSLMPTLTINGASPTNPITTPTSIAPSALGAGIQVTQNGSTTTLTSTTGATPAQIIAAIQVSTGSGTTPGAQTLILGATGTATGGSFTLGTANLPSGGSFTTLVLPALVTGNVTATSTVTVTGAATIDGTLDFQSGSSAALSAAGVTVASGGTISSTASLAITDTGANALSNAGTISGTTVTLTANTAGGTIAQGGVNGVVNATTSLSLSAVNGAIGASGVLLAVDTPVLSASTTGSVWVSDSTSVTLSGTNSASSYNLTTTGSGNSIIVSATVTGATGVSLTSAAGISGAGAITATTGNAVLTANGGGITNSGLITTSAAAGDVLLTADGNIWQNKTTALTVATSNLSAISTGADPNGNVLVSDNESVTLIQNPNTNTHNSAVDIYSVITTTGGITVTDSVTGGTGVSLTSAAGISGAGALTATTGNAVLTANGGGITNSGLITTSAAAGDVLLTADGNIWQNKTTALTVATSNLSAISTGADPNGNVLVSDNEAVTLIQNPNTNSHNSALDIYSVITTTGGITVTDSVTGGTGVSLASAAGISGAGAITATTGNAVLTANGGGITNSGLITTSAAAGDVLLTADGNIWQNKTTALTVATSNLSAISTGADPNGNVLVSDNEAVTLIQNPNTNTHNSAVDIYSVATTTGGITVTDSVTGGTGVSLTSAAGISGAGAITATTGNAVLTANGGGITNSGLITSSAAAGDVLLTADGNIWQNKTTALTVATSNLSAISTGTDPAGNVLVSDNKAVTLIQNPNTNSHNSAVDIYSVATTTGGITVTDSVTGGTGVSFTSAAGISGAGAITATTGNAVLTANGGGITNSGLITTSAAAGDVLLTADGNIWQNKTTALTVATSNLSAISTGTDPNGNVLVSDNEAVTLIQNPNTNSHNSAVDIYSVATTTGGITVTDSVTGGTGVSLASAAGISGAGAITATTGNAVLTANGGGITNSGLITTSAAAGDVLLTADGNIWQNKTTALTVATSNLSAISTGANPNGNVLVSDNEAVTLIQNPNTNTHNSAVDTYSVTTSTGGITVTDSVTGGTGVSLTSAAGISGAGAITATTGNAVLTANGGGITNSGLITTSAAAGDVLLTADGNIWQNKTTALTVATSNLSAISTGADPNGNVLVSDNEAVTLIQNPNTNSHNSAVDIYSVITTTGGITVTDSVTGGTGVSLTSAAGISGAGAITATTGNAVLTANGGGITNSGLITTSAAAGDVLLTADGNIWQNKTTALTVATSNLSAISTGANPNGNVLVSDNEAVTLIQNPNTITHNSAVDTYSVTTSTGGITVTDSVTGGTGVSLTSAAGISGAGAITATTGNAVLTANGGGITNSGLITTSAAAGDVLLTADGNIWQNKTTALTVATSNLSAISTGADPNGNVLVSDNEAVTLIQNPNTNSHNSALDIYSVITTTGGITVTDSITGGTGVSLTSAAGISGAGAITATTGNAVLTANGGGITNSGLITTSAAAGDVLLTADGNIWQNKTTALTVATSNLSAISTGTDPNGNVLVSDNEAVTLIQNPNTNSHNSAVDTYSVITTTGGITVTDSVTGGTGVSLTSAAGISGAGAITATTGNAVLTANGGGITNSGLITTSAAAGDVLLTADGNIWQNKTTALTVATSNLSAISTGADPNGNVLVSDNEAVTLIQNPNTNSHNSALDIYSVITTTGGITVTDSVTGGTGVSLTSAAGISGAGAITATTANAVLTANGGGITNSGLITTSAAAGDVLLTADGNIWQNKTTALTVATSNLSAISTGADPAGNVLVSDNEAVTLIQNPNTNSHNSAVDTYSVITTTGGITVTDSVTGGTGVSLTSAAGISGAGAITATTGNAVLTANGGGITNSGLITTSAAAGDVLLTADGNIWQNKTTALTVATSNLSAISTGTDPNGNVLVSDNEAVTLIQNPNTNSHNSAVDIYSVTTTTGGITVNDSVTGGTGVSLTSAAGISGAGAITATTGNAVLTANGGGITNSGLITTSAAAGDVLLTADGNIWQNKTTALTVATSNLSAISTGTGPNGNVLVSDNEAVTLIQNPNTNSHNSAVDTYCVTTTSGNITISDSVTGGTGVSLTSAGSISGSSLITATANAVNLDAATNIGAAATGAGNAVNVSASSLNANATSGFVNVSDNESVTLTANGGLHNAAGSTYTLTTTGNGIITVSDSVTGATGVTLTSAGSISGSSLITANANAVNLDAATSIGSSASPLQTEGAGGGTINLTANATSGGVFINNMGSVDLVGTNSSGGAFSLTTSGTGSTITLASGTDTLNATGALTLTTSALDNSSSIQGGSVQITGLTGQALTITNSGTITATSGNIEVDSAANENVYIGNGTTGVIAGPDSSLNVSGTNDIIINANGGVSSTNQIVFNGSQNLNTAPGGLVQINANIGAGQSVAVIGTGSAPANTTYVTGNNAVNVNTSAFTQSFGSLSANPLTVFSGPGAGTITDTSGNLTLSSNLIFEGQSLTILATGNITSTASIAIDLSGAAGTPSANGGALTIIAGYDFTPATSSGASTPAPGTFTVTGASAGGGFVSLGSVTIATGSTQTAGNGGNVVVVASAGTGASSGNITLGSINTSATATAGNVTLIGQAITVGAINTTGGTASGIVTIASAAPVIVGPVSSQYGHLLGSFAAGTALGGNIALSGTNAGTAAVSVTTGVNTTTNIGGNITSSAGAIVGGTINLTTAAGTLGGGDIAIGAGGINTGATGSVTLATSGTGLISTSGAGIINTGTINLNVGTGSAGALTQALAINAATINSSGVSDTQGSVYLTDSNTAISVNNNSVGTFNLVGSNALATITVNGNAGGLDSNSINISTPGTIAVSSTANTLAAAPDVSGNGGTLILSASAFANASVISPTSPLTLSANGSTGKGGDVSVTVTGTTPATVTLGGIGTTNNFILSATGDAGALSANGGTVSLTTPGALVITDTAGSITSVLTVASSTTSGNGGNIAISANSINWATAASDALSINVNGTGSGKGGTIAITLTAPAAPATTIGTLAGDYNLSASSGSTGGNGGSITFSTTGALNIVTDASGNANYVLGTGLPSGYGLNVAQLGANGNGGTINLTAGSLTWSTQAAEALGINVNGSGTGNGGTIDIALTAATGTNAIIGASLGDYNLTAVSGGTGGNGGTVSFFTTGTLALITNGTGSPTGISVEPTTSGNGGNIALTANTISWGTTGTTLDTVLLLNADGVGTGNGGTIAISLTGTSTATGATIGTGNGDYNLSAGSGATSGNGGAISFSTSGTLSIVTDSNGNGNYDPLTAGTNPSTAYGLNVAPLGTTGNGGTINLTAGSLTWSTKLTKALILNADGANAGVGGLGGFISVVQSSATGLTVGTSTGQLSLSAVGGNNIKLPDGSGVSVTSGDTLVVNNSGIVVMAVGTNTDGENVTLSSNSKTVFNYGLATAANKNGVLGTIDVAGIGSGADGSLTLINNGGGVTNSVAVTGVGDLTMFATVAGGVAIGKAISTSSSVTLDVVGSGSITGSQLITTNSLDVSTGSGNIGALTVAAFNINANSSSGAVTITDKNAEGTVATINSGSSGLTKAFSFTDTLGSIAVDGNITAGTSLVLKASATTGTNGNITIAGNLDATGINGAVTITAGGATGNGGSITANSGDISAAKTVTLTAAKGDITVDTVGAVTPPATIAMTAFNNITNNGTVEAATTITEKTTNAGTTASPSTATIAVLADIETTSTTANTGAITLTDAGAGGITSAGFDIGAGKSVTLTAAKGSMILGTIGALTKVPTTVSISALNNIINTSAVSASTTISEKTTYAGTTAGPSTSSIVVLGNMETTSIAANTGTISLTATGNGGITSAGFDLGGGKSVTLAATKGFIAVGTIGGQLPIAGSAPPAFTLVPATVSLGAYSDITNYGALIAGTTITEKTTNAGTTAAPSTSAILALGNIETTSTTAGAITLTDSGSGGITTTNYDIGAVKSVTLTASKGSIEAGTIGGGVSVGGKNVPTTVSFSAYNSITNNGVVSAATSVSEKTTNAGTTASPSSSTINVLANIETTGSTSTIALTSTGTGAEAINSTGDLGAGKAITLSATRGSITVGSIGGLLLKPTTVSLTALNNITNLGVINAQTSLTEKTTSVSISSASEILVSGNIDITNAANTTGTVSLTNAAPVISGDQNGITATSNITANKSVLLSATKGDIVLTDAITAGTTVTATAFDGITQSGSIVAGTTASLSTTSALGTNLKGGITVNNISTGTGGTGGAISVIAAGGALTVLGAADISSTSTTNKALVTLENKLITGATTGTIVIDGSTTATGTNISTTNTTTGGTGNVNIVMGAVPAPKFGTVPNPNNAIYKVNGITVAPAAGGPFFFGSGTGKTITIVNPGVQDLITISSVGNGTTTGRVIFNTGNLAANAITVNAGTTAATTITADPPTGSAAPSTAAVAQARTELVNALGLTQAPGQANTISNTQAPGASIPAASAQNSTLVLGSLGTNMVNTGALGTGSLTGSLSTVSGTIGNVAITSGQVGAVQSSIVEGASTTNSGNTSTPATRTLYGAATEFGVPEETMYIGRGAAKVGEIDAAVVAGSEMGLGGPTNKNLELAGWTGPDTKVMTLRKGNVVVAPDQDTVIETSFGQVSVAAHSMALIMALPSGTAVYNLDDTRKNSIVITIGKNQMTLTPGRHAMVTSHLVEGFEMVNPAESFSYRNIESKKLDGDLQAFTSEFSMANAIGNVKQMRALVNSRNPQAKRMASHLLKTAAILSQLSGSSGYEHYQHPRMTATAMLPK